MSDFDILLIDQYSRLIGTLISNESGYQYFLDYM